MAIDIQGFISSSVRGIGNALVKVTKPIVSAVERHLVGKTREYLNNRSLFNKKLMGKARQSSTGMAVESLGLLGNVAALVPGSKEELSEILDTIDKRPESRNAHTAFRFFSGGDVFILAAPGHQGIHLRKELSAFLAPSKFIGPTVFALQGIEYSGNIRTRQTVCTMVRAVLMDVILGIKKMPEDTYSVMKEYRADTKEWAAHHFPRLFQYMPSLIQKRKEYRNFSEDIMAEEFPSLVAELRKYSPGGKITLTCTTILGLIRKDYPGLSEDEIVGLVHTMPEAQIADYYKDDSIQVMPFLLKAADNLTDAISIVLNNLAKNPLAQIKMREEIERAGIEDVTKDLNQAMRQMPYLDAWFKEVLRFDTPAAVPRYTGSAIQTRSGKTIPAHTTILFDLAAINKSKAHWTDPDSFNPERFLSDLEGVGGSESQRKPGEYPFLPFSAGARMCPATKVTEYIFKAYVAYMVMNFDIQLDPEVDNDAMSEDESIIYLEKRAQFSNAAVMACN